MDSSGENLLTEIRCQLMQELYVPHTECEAEIQFSHDMMFRQSFSAEDGTGDIPSIHGLCHARSVGNCFNNSSDINREHLLVMDAYDNGECRTRARRPLAHVAEPHAQEIRPGGPGQRE